MGRTRGRLNLGGAAVARRLAGGRHPGGVQLRVVVHAVLGAVEGRPMPVRVEARRGAAPLPHLRPRRVLLPHNGDSFISRSYNSPLLSPIPRCFRRFPVAIIDLIKC